MKKYIRTTHNYDNETRSWVYRGKRGQDKFKEWTTPEVESRSVRGPKWSLGVHGVREWYWVTLDEIVDETIKMFKAGASDNTQEFYRFIIQPGARDQIKKDVQEELDWLVSMDMVRVKE